jgi:pSer/pThr/pTyr-binding forkhead associated (FHA) protein
MGKLRLVASDGSVLELEKERGVLGRDKDCDLRLEDRSISRRHVVLEQRDGGWHFVDQGSANGTQLDGRRASEGALAHGQELKVGTVALRVELEDDLATVLIDPTPTADRTVLLPVEDADPPTPSRPMPPPLPRSAHPQAAPAAGLAPREAAAARLGVAANASSWEVKARYDATDLFRSNHPVEPAA